MNDHSHIANIAIPEVGLTEIDGEPRARDLDLAERLGFSRPRDIRKLIERNIVEITTYGPCATVARPVQSNEVSEYWLSEEQALLVAVLSNAANAPAVRAMLIKAFVAWRRGHAALGMVLPPELVEQIRRTAGISRMLSHKVTEMEKVNASLIATLTAQTAALAAITAVMQPPHPILVRHGKTAGEIWRGANFPPIKITCWFGNRLKEQGCLMEGRAEVGGRTIRLFDPDKAQAWLRNGGRLLVEQKLAERLGQGKLRLVPTQPQPSDAQ